MIFDLGAQGQLRDHQGQLGRRQRRLPARRLSRRSSATPSTAGDIKIVGETYTDNWDPALAQTEMEQFLTASNNDVQAVLSENDGMAGGVVAALEAQGLAGQVPGLRPGRRQGRRSTGSPSAPRRSTSGRTPACSAQAAGEAAVAALRQPRRQRRRRAPTQFTSPGGNDLTSILLKPQPITPGQPRRRARRRLDRPGDAVPGRRGRTVPAATRRPACADGTRRRHRADGTVAPRHGADDRHRRVHAGARAGAGRGACRRHS